MNRVIAIYPGSFDPPTNGHLDLIERGSQIFDELIVAILRNAEKKPLFSLAERRRMLEELTRPFANVRVDTFDGLTVEYATRVKAKAVLRGIRAISDYEYELQMALMNRKLHPELETVFMMPADKYSYLSSRLVREVAQLGGSIKGSGAGDGRKKAQTKIGPGNQTTTRVGNGRWENEYDSSREAIAPLKLTERINRIQPSATMAVVAEADKLRQQGVDVVDLSVGEPHFSTPRISRMPPSPLSTPISPGTRRWPARRSCAMPS